MIVNQVAITMFGLMLSFATTKNDTLLLLSGILSAGMYLFLLYNMCWEEGAKDKIKVDAGRQKKEPFKALFNSLIANILNIILGVVIIVSDLLENTGKIAIDIFNVSSVLARFIEAMYLGIISYLENVLIKGAIPTVMFLAIVIPALVASHLGYTLGHRNFRILSLFGIKVKPYKSK